MTSLLLLLLALAAPVGTLQTRLRVEIAGDVRFLLDGQPILTVAREPGTNYSAKVEGRDGDYALVLRAGPRELARAHLARLDVGAAELPPLWFAELDQVALDCTSTSLNGKTHTKARVNRILVYDGPGASCQSHHDERRREVSVTVDGKVVYRAGAVRPAR
jgi:hypothetical protein